MPVEFTASLVLALKKSFRMPDDIKDDSPLYSHRLKERIKYLLKEKIRIPENDVPPFDIDESHIQEFLDIFEINIDDLREGYYILVSDSKPYLKNEFYSYFFTDGIRQIELIEERRNLVGDNLILVYAFTSAP